VYEPLVLLFPTKIRIKSSLSYLVTKLRGIASVILVGLDGEIPSACCKTVLQMVEVPSGRLIITIGVIGTESRAWTRSLQRPQPL
jgi:hypothetical protein